MLQRKTFVMFSAALRNLGLRPADRLPEHAENSIIECRLSAGQPSRRVTIQETRIVSFSPPIMVMASARVQDAFFSGCPAISGFNSVSWVKGLG